MQRLALSLLATLVSLNLFFAPSIIAETLVVNQHYDLISPAIPRSGDKPEVAEVFNFKCPHCRTLSGPMAEWAKKNQDRFSYKAVPVFWGKQTNTPLRALFAAEFLGKGEEMKKALFKAHFEESMDIENVQDLGFLAEEVDLDPAKFKNYLDSFGVSAKIAQAKALQRAFGVHSTPTIVINGKYRVSPGKHANNDPKRLFQMIEILAHQ